MRSNLLAVVVALCGVGGFGWLLWDYAEQEGWWATAFLVLLFTAGRWAWFRRRKEGGPLMPSSPYVEDMKLRKRLQSARSDQQE